MTKKECNVDVVEIYRGELCHRGIIAIGSVCFILMRISDRLTELSNEKGQRDVT